MSSATSSFLFLVLLFSAGCSSVNQPSLEDSFRQCLISQPSVMLGHCLGVGAVTKLQSLDSNQEFDLIDGVTLTRDQQEYREAYNYAERDPADFRTLIDSIGHVFSRRTMQWDMGFLYPGLGMRIAPSIHPGGMLEFVLDPHREAINKHSLKEIGTGKLLARQFLVPFLLGFKFNIATLIPILFGLLALLAKKAVIISKIALVVASGLGLGTLLLGNGNRIPQDYQAGGFNPGFGGGSHYNNRYRFPEGEYLADQYRGIPANNEDPLELYGKLRKSFTPEETSAKGRNFAWSEAEKAKKA